MRFWMRESQLPDGQTEVFGEGGEEVEGFEFALVLVLRLSKRCGVGFGFGVEIGSACKSRV